MLKRSAKNMKEDFLLQYQDVLDAMAAGHAKTTHIGVAQERIASGHRVIMMKGDKQVAQFTGEEKLNKFLIEMGGGNPDVIMTERYIHQNVVNLVFDLMASKSEEADCLVRGLKSEYQQELRKTIEKNALLVFEDTAEYYVFGRSSDDKKKIIYTG